MSRIINRWIKHRGMSEAIARDAVFSIFYIGNANGNRSALFSNRKTKLISRFLYLMLKARVFTLSYLLVKCTNTVYSNIYFTYGLWKEKFVFYIIVMIISHDYIMFPFIEILFIEHLNVNLFLKKI